MKQTVICLLLISLCSLNLIAQPDGEGSPADFKSSDPPANEMPADFKSDGCTLFPDGNYRDCCVAHDKDYYKGGSCKERRRSDNRLYRCVRNKKGWQNKVIAPIMWLGVRLGGVPLLPTPFRWGFGKKKMKKAKKVKNAK